MIVGHIRQQQLLDLHIRTGTLSHAYLFAGPRHVGKMTIALQMVSSLLCKKRPPAFLASCGTCEACRAVAFRTHPDVTMEDIYANEKKELERISIDKIRHIRDLAARSAHGSTRIFILRDVGRLTREASHAFLKTLEEPRGKTVFLLIAETVDDVLPTIRSRTSLIRFWPVTEELLTAHLIQTLCLPENDALTITHLSHGRVGIALKLAKEPHTAWNELEKQHEQTRALFFAPAADRLRFADSLRENPAHMHAWYDTAIMLMSSALHTTLLSVPSATGKTVNVSEQTATSLHLAIALKRLLEGETRFSKSYGTKRILFESDILQI